MPHSEKTHDDTIRRFLQDHFKFKRFVDIGPGAGKYGRMIRLTIPKARIVAVEAHYYYAQKFQLSKLYDELFIARAEDYFFDPARADFEADVVFMGDVLEHIRKSAGLDLVHYFAYRAKYQIIVYPRRRRQFSACQVGLPAHTMPPERPVSRCRQT